MRYNLLRTLTLLETLTIFWYADTDFGVASFAVFNPKRIFKLSIWLHSEWKLDWACCLAGYGLEWADYVSLWEPYPSKEFTAIHKHQNHTLIILLDQTNLTHIVPDFLLQLLNQLDQASALDQWVNILFIKGNLPSLAFYLLLWLLSHFPAQNLSCIINQMPTHISIPTRKPYVKPHPVLFDPIFERLLFSVIYGCIFNDLQDLFCPVQTSRFWISFHLHQQDLSSVHQVM